MTMERLAFLWWRGQMDLAGFPPHFVVFVDTDHSRTIFGQLQAMGDHGF